MTARSSLSLSEEDRDRVEEIQLLARGGEEGVARLVDWLGEKSWAVRRAVVAALARIGTPSIEPLCALLANDRSSETRIAAAVDALVLASGDVDAVVIRLGEKSESPAVICDVAQILGRRKSGGAIPILAKLSVHDDDNVAVAAIEALGRIGGTTAIEPLIAAVRTRNFFRTFPAIEVLGRSGDPRVVAPLRELLNDPLYAAEAAAALGRTGQIAAVLPLVHLIRDAQLEGVGSVTRALIDLRDRHVALFGDATALLQTFRETLQTTPLTKKWIAALDHGTPEEKAALAAILGWSEDPSVVRKLIELLAEDSPVKEEAAKAIRVMGAVAEPELLLALQASNSEQRLRLLPLVSAKRTNVAALIACLDDADAAVQSQACEALSRIGDLSAIPALFRIIGDADARVSQSSVAAIQSLGSAEVESLAIAAARSNDTRTRRAALRIVAYFGYPSGLDVLLLATTDPNERIREVATHGLAFIDDPKALEGLIRLSEDPSPQTRAAAMRALGQTAKNSVVVEKIRPGLTDADPWVRYYASQALSRLGARECIPEIALLTADAAGQVRVAAVEALAKLGGPEAQIALEQATESNDHDVRRAALTGLGSMKSPSALPVLLRAVSSADAATRLITLSALGAFESPAVFAAIVSAMSDSDAHVRSAAMALMEQRTDRNTARWLVEQLRDETRREWSLAVLAAPREHRLEEVLAALENADAVMAPLLVSILSRMHRADGNAAMISALGFENVFARRAAAAVLVASALGDARPALKLASEIDPDDEVRKISAAAL